MEIFAKRTHLGTLGGKVLSISMKVYHLLFFFSPEWFVGPLQKLPTNFKSQIGMLYFYYLFY